MKKTAKRIVTLYILFTFCFMGIMVRIININLSSYSVNGKNQSTRTINIGTSRGNIYDRNMIKLVNTKSDLVAVVTPVSSCESFIKPYLSEKGIKEKIGDGYPFTLEVGEEINNELIRTFSVPCRYSETDLAVHLTGYTDQSGKGVYGIEKAFDSFLTNHSGSLVASFSVNALGKILAGMDKTITDTNFNSSAGVVLTLDKKIQKITEDALKESDIESGCALVLSADTKEVLAMASVPVFDRLNIENSLESENSPFLNKALTSYSAGSVFKSIIAAFYLEQIGSDKTYTCTGTIKVGDKEFSCPGKKAHGKQNLETALENSCNTYFVNLTRSLDSEKLLTFCESLGLGSSTKLCNGLTGEKGLLPTKESLALSGNMANFSFGQGDLLVTPIQLAAAYCTLATGNYSAPTVLKGFINGNNIFEEAAKNESAPLLKESTVKKLRKMLLNVTEKGIAYNAKDTELSLAGKTGTAESGITGNDGEILRTWFAGFFPAENPQYVVVVLNENGISGNFDCAPVFRKICDKISKVSH